MSPAATKEAASLLAQAARGDTSAAAEFLPLVYDDLRKLAARYLRRERRGHTLEPTALVNEAYVHLVRKKHVDWRSRTHFFAVAAREMRHVLVDHARRRSAGKRGGGLQRVPLASTIVDPRENRAIDLIDLAEALEKLSELDPRASAVFELRFFGGLTASRVASELGVSQRVVEEDWRTARAWLRRALRPRSGSG
ncbi:MAG: sigma-70 family RNA polymerase sigma factor [Planctomycetes bacterium]|nr:sigma-70 family RNA polymerase sigma factor [Planctomycetota bacterium]